jgi:hypothetical protein
MPILRIHGLSSAKGQRLNGLVGVVEAFDRVQEGERVGVWIDGEPEPDGHATHCNKLQTHS